MISIKIHSSYRIVVAVCDSELIGKKFEEGIRQLDLRESFYKDKEMNEEDAIKTIEYQMKEDATFNIVGKKSIGVALKAQLITSKQVDKIAEIPFALTLL
jgi:uncharacterized protein